MPAYCRDSKYEKNYCENTKRTATSFQKFLNILFNLFHLTILEYNKNTTFGINNDYCNYSGNNLGSPYRVPFSSAILQLQEAGKLHQLKIKWWKEKNGGGKCKVRMGHRFIKMTQKIWTWLDIPHHVFSRVFICKVSLSKG